MKTVQALALVLSVGFLAAPRAMAQVESFGVQKSQFARQTADNTAPASENSYSVFGYVNTNSSSDANSFTLSDDSTATGSFSLTGTGGSYAGSGFYSSLAAMNADYPAGSNYVFTAVGGNLDGQSESVGVPSDDYAPYLYLTGNSFSLAQMANVNSSLTLTFTQSDLGGTETSADVIFTLFDTTTGTSVFENDFQAGADSENSVTIPQSVLASLNPADTYSGQLANFVEEEDLPSSGDFNDISFADNFVSTLDFDFGVVPEPGTYALLGVGAAALVALRLRRRGRA